jgi:hypothetical protein
MRRSLGKQTRIAALAAAMCAALMCAALMIPVIAAEPAFTTKTAADKSASVGVPAGWKLTTGAQGFLAVDGPHSEHVSLGVLVVGKNASGGVSGQAAFVLPYSAALQNKFVTIVQAGAVKSHMAVPQITFAGVTATKLPMCSQFLGGWTAGGVASNFEAVLCSMAPDVLGYYKNLVFLAQVPASLAQQDRPIVEKIAASYRVTPAEFQKMLAPYTAIPKMPAGSAGAAPALAPYQMPNTDCFDYTVIRESPPWEMPMHCGGTMPG